ncbi:hypothetical protein J3P85_19555 [Pseudomonas sp. Z1-12]
MTARRWVVPLIVTGMSQMAWGYGEIDQLAGSTVLASGGLERVNCPPFGDYDSTGLDSSAIKLYKCPSMGVS